MKYIALASLFALSTVEAVTPDYRQYEKFDTFFLPRAANHQQIARTRAWNRAGDRRWDLMVNPNLVFGPAYETEWNDQWYYKKNGPINSDTINKDQESRTTTSLVQLSNQDKLYAMMEDQI